MQSQNSTASAETFLQKESISISLVTHLLVDGPRWIFVIFKIQCVCTHCCLRNAKSFTLALSKSPSSTVRGSRLSRNYKARKYHSQQKFDIL